ncbi:hypothetical protein O181_091970 [Austropuccinia psidii MF-1]|uniref:Uncharacterized protein n=1 Tax=Austropuccinia psidii MF-1 TaxID=1389203 RepID=A0A9Q3IXN5_9BASI|nr:hypothetical protein [Austropuccinia psidii MF-1]
MNSYLHIKSLLGLKKTIKLSGGWSQLFFKDKVKRIKNWLKNQRLLSIHQKKELDMTPDLEKEGPVASTRSRSVQRQAQRTSEEADRSQDTSRKGKRKSHLAQTLPTGVQDPQIGTFSNGQCLQFSQDSYLIHSQGSGKDEPEFFTQIIQEIKLVKTSINIELSKIDANLTKITLDINELKKKHIHSAKYNKSTTARLELISNTCDRIESKYQVHDYEMEDLSTTSINDQINILKNHVLTVVDKTKKFAIHAFGKE